VADRLERLEHAIDEAILRRSLKLSHDRCVFSVVTTKSGQANISIATAQRLDRASGDQVRARAQSVKPSH
jgi:hypothetical protein